MTQPSPFTPVQIPIAVTRMGQPLTIVWFQLVIADHRGARRSVEPSPENIERELMAHFQGDWQRYRIIAAGDLPADRTYRRAWTDTGSAIEIDLEEAKTLYRERIAFAAAPRIRALAEQILDALADGRSGDVERLRRERRTLEAAKDDPRIAEASTLAELTAIDALTSLRSSEP